jgi:hypothetical protein
VLRAFGGFIAVAGIGLLAWGGAGAATPERAEFRVALTGTLTKDWTYSQVVEGECDKVTAHVGQWRLQLTTRRPSTIAITRLPTRLSLSPSVVRSIAGQATQSGSRRMWLRGTGCVRDIRRTNCADQRRSFRGASAQLTNPTRGRARFAGLRGASAARSFRRACPEEPPEIRSIRPDLGLAEAPLSAADAFDRSVTRFFIRGNSTQVTTISGPYAGRVTERVRWTLTFTRVR